MSKKQKKSKKAKSHDEKEEKELEEDTEEEKGGSPEEDPIDPFGMLLANVEKPDLRTLGIFGEINEERAAEIVIGLIMMTHGEEEEKKPIDFYLSTYGGNADDMFTLYDMMTVIKNKGHQINTFGLGKVMSAGVLLLAAGSPGHRKIGRHCRVMIHACNAGNIGDIYNLQNEMEAIQDLQEKYSNAIVENTSMTKRQLKKLLERKVNIYLTADEAIEYGIADEII